MKTKFQRLSKEEKKNAINEYKSVNELFVKRYNKLNRICIFGICYSIIALIVDFSIKDSIETTFIPQVIVDCVVLVFCVSMFLFGRKMLEKNVNNYLVEKLHNEQKEKWAKERISLEKREKKNNTKKQVKEKKEKVKKNGKTTKSNS